jgi:hypothetical protein
MVLVADLCAFARRRTHNNGMTEASQSDSFPAEWLNRECFCIGADRAGLQEWLRRDLAARGYDWRIVETHPHLFSELPVFVRREHIDRMRGVIAAIEHVVRQPAYVAAAIADAPAIAQFAPNAGGVFFGYDFHLGSAGPQLIEINTNAGGALLNAELGAAQRACCPEVADYLTGPPADPRQFEARVMQAFLTEWRLERGAAAPLECIAIVDDRPMDQYLYPEFLLFQRLFAAHGLRSLVVDASELAYVDGALQAQGQRIDLVYNRLTDFYFNETTHSALREAYLRSAVVVTPHPRAHALYANKRNLARLTDRSQLESWQVPAATVDTLLGGIPTTRIVRPEDADALWAERSRWFFKPAHGYGSRGSYRGDKLTRRVFAEIVAGDYIAQAVVAPSERNLRAGDAVRSLKVDLRMYVHEATVQLLAARLYQGQTTNFRTPGGGFAPVFYPAV